MDVKPTLFISPDSSNSSAFNQCFDFDLFILFPLSVVQLNKHFVLGNTDHRLEEYKDCRDFHWGTMKFSGRKELSLDLKYEFWRNLQVFWH